MGTVCLICNYPSDRGNDEGVAHALRAEKILFVENHRVFAETVIDQFLVGHDVLLVPTVAEAKGVLSQNLDVVLVDYDAELRAAGAKVTCSTETSAQSLPR